MTTTKPTYRPSAVGSLFTAHNSQAEIFAFSAKERDVETGLSYFGARYYSSDLSIWLSVDPMAYKYPSLSPYVYCYNNPVITFDPNGERGIIVVNQQCDANGNVIGGTATLVMHYYYNSTQTGSMSDDQVAYVKDNICNNMNQLVGQNITIDGIKYSFDYRIDFIDIKDGPGASNYEGWANCDKYGSSSIVIGNYLESKTLDGDDVGQGSKYRMQIDFDKLFKLMADGITDGQTPIHELLHNLGATDTGINGNEIMDKAIPGCKRELNIGDIENLLQMHNERLMIIYED